MQVNRIWKTNPRGNLKKKIYTCVSDFSSLVLLEKLFTNKYLSSGLSLNEFSGRCMAVRKKITLRKHSRMLGELGYRNILHCWYEWKCRSGSGGRRLGFGLDGILHVAGRSRHTGYALIVNKSRRSDLSCASRRDWWRGTGSFLKKKKQLKPRLRATPFSINFIGSSNARGCVIHLY